MALKLQIDRNVRDTSEIAKTILLQTEPGQWLRTHTFEASRPIGW